MSKRFKIIDVMGVRKCQFCGITRNDVTSLEMNPLFGDKIEVSVCKVCLRELGTEIDESIAIPFS